MDESNSAKATKPVFDMPPFGVPKERSYLLLGRQPMEGPLKWVVLDSDPLGETTLISEKVLDFCCYTNETVEEIDYGMSELEDRIGCELIYELFSSEERRFFCSLPRPASAEEIEDRFGTDEERMAFPTPYALSRCKGLGLGPFGSAPYWTTTAGTGIGHNAFVQPDGDINRHGRPFDEPLGIRLIVKLKVDPRVPPWNTPRLHESIYNAINGYGKEAN